MLNPDETTVTNVDVYTENKNDHNSSMHADVYFEDEKAQACFKQICAQSSHMQKLGLAADDTSKPAAVHHLFSVSVKHKDDQAILSFHETSTDAENYAKRSPIQLVPVMLEQWGIINHAAKNVMDALIDNSQPVCDRIAEIEEKNADWRDDVASSLTSSFGKK